MSKPFAFRHALDAAIVAALFACAMPQVFAQSSANERAEERRARHAAKKEGDPAAAPAQAALYPNATRAEPEAKASAKLSPKLKTMFDAYDNDDAVKATAIADEIIADGKANAYERAIASRIAGASLINTDEARAKAYLLKAIEYNGLSNNEHYETMQLIAQLQLQEDKYAEGLATMDRFLTETKSQKPENLVIKGNALYRLERYPEAAALLKQAIAATPEPKADWLQLLMATYFEMDQPGEAAKIAEELLAKNPNDKKLQMNLASIYMQANQTDKAAAMLEKIRAGGQLGDDKDYRNLYALYLNSEGKEKEAIAVINEGLQKGVLKPDHQTYLALAQAYYFSDQPAQAIDAYKKAAPLAADGETYLNLAKVLWQEGRMGEAKQAAQQALGKGLKKPEDAKKILAQPGN